MFRVLIVSPVAIDDWLERTPLARRDVERHAVVDYDAAVPVAERRRPDVIVINASDHANALLLVEKLRSRNGTSRLPIATIVDDAASEAAVRLLRAGSNVVLPGDARGAPWDRLLEGLLPGLARRAVRISCRLAVWCASEIETGVTGVAHDLSSRGLSVETEAPLALGGQYQLRFALPGRPGECSGVGRVIRQVPTVDGRTLSGIEFVVLLNGARRELEDWIETRSG